MRTLSFLALAAALAGLLGGPAAAQPKGPPPKTLDLYEQFRATMSEGKFDIAGIYLEEFLKSGPSNADFATIEKKYGTTAFSSLRAVPKFSDNPANEKKIRADVEKAIELAQAVRTKTLYTPERVNKYITNLAKSYEEKLFAQQELKRTGEYAVPFMIDALRTSPPPELYQGLLETIPILEGDAMAGWVAALDGLSTDQQYGVLSQLAKRRDVRNLLTNAQTDFAPYLWRVLSRPKT
ncbi:MAG: hypothetical protein K2V38_29400, partial [Gemmataceae bacterium]|nr:hypothetical protein [Gemmataceae bacterium]